MINSTDILMGILRHCDELQADSAGIHKALFKLSQIYPDIFSCCEFDTEGVSYDLNEDLERFILTNLVGICGTKFETLVVNPRLKSRFDSRHAKKFTPLQLESLRAMGISFPKLLKKTESVRYTQLVNNER